MNQTKSDLLKELFCALSGNLSIQWCVRLGESWAHCEVERDEDLFLSVTDAADYEIVDCELRG